MSVNATSPEDLFGGIWEALDQGRVLIGASTSHPAGETGGAESVALTVAEMPSHNHSGSLSGVSVSSAGSHSHSASLSGKSTGDAGTHNHSRGTMNITGKFESAGAFCLQKGTGAFSGSGSGSAPGTYNQPGQNIMNFDASDNWTGNTSSGGSHSLSGSVTTGSAGSHTHNISGSVSIGSSGSGGAHNNMQPYLSVYMWKRIA